MINKKLVMVGLMASAALVVGCGKDAKKTEAPKIETLDQKISYLMGQQMGKGVQQMEITLDKDLLLLAIADAKAAAEAQVKIAELEKKDKATLTKEETAELEKLQAAVKPRISEEDAAKVSTEFQALMQKKQEEKQKKLSETNGAEGTKFLADNKAKEGVKTTASGLQYKVITEGKGVTPKATDIVKVHYTGKLVNGTVFDSSTGKEPVEFPVNGVIPGWVEALQLMPQGSKWELYIPSDLAYGPAGNQGIPPASTLIFEVELLEVKAPAAEVAPAKPAKK